MNYLMLQITYFQKNYPSLCTFLLLLQAVIKINYESLKIKMIKSLLYRRAKDSISVGELTFLTSYQGQTDKIRQKTIILSCTITKFNIIYYEDLDKNILRCLDITYEFYKY